MTMLTPITRAMTGPVTVATPSEPVTAIPPIRPAAEPQNFAEGDAERDRSRDDRDRGAETTLRYKFDWLVQRQVRAGAIDPDEAAEMIRLFDRTVDPSEDDNDTAATDLTADPPADPTGARAMPPQGPDAAAALLDRMRDRFGVDGPYDDSGGQTPSTPAGMLVDEQL